MTLVTMFNGANGPLNGGGSACGVIAAVGLAVKAIGDDVVAGAASVRVRTAGLDVVSVTRTALGDSSVEVVEVESSCGSENVEIADGVIRDDVLGALLVPPFGADAAVGLVTSS
jgi:hypothetical protein